MKKVLLVGTGNIARDYVKVLRGLNVPFGVIGRSEEGCGRFSEELGVPALPGGVERYPNMLDQFSDAILAIDASQLSGTACILMNRGIRNLLVEKPGGLTKRDLAEMDQLSKQTGSQVYIAYNRRFYASVMQAEKIARDDGGIQSFHFEFTEWPHSVLAAGLPPETIENWFLCNSTHIIDLAFYMGSLPKEFVSFAIGHAAWTKEHTCFSGAGVSQSGALFDYCANWDAPGRWNVELLTSRHRLVFRPIEKLQIQELKSVKIEFDEKTDYSLDVEYKPGLWKEVSAFLGIDEAERYRLKTVEQQLDMFPIYEKIAGRIYK